MPSAPTVPSAVFSLSNVEKIELSDGVPDGEYSGIWNGYTVEFKTPCGEYRATSSVGIRGWCDCVVVVKCGQFKVKQKENNAR